ncbi:CsbD family protein [Pseudanabaena sp. BC1403]|uniref:CsbD family protein n=1 Tax=Pseudanabaena sp. BC1403 TaxID=2043171 RepID=UPI0021564900|nr:CsbD family protein [Pseudanabaena sp. BC1403]
MILRIYRSLLNIGLISILSFTFVFGIAIQNSSAEQSFTQLVNPPHTAIATMGKIKATAKDIEGKTQEAIGNVTGNAKNQIIGKAKQAEADARKATENIKDGVKLPERVNASVENLEGKTQEAFGNLTGDRRDQVTGKAKQIESKTRNLMEDAKDKLKGMLE